MKKSLFASEKVMVDYLDDLLFDDELRVNDAAMPSHPIMSQPKFAEPGQVKPGASISKINKPILEKLLNQVVVEQTDAALTKPTVPVGTIKTEIVAKKPHQLNEIKSRKGQGFVSTKPDALSETKPKAVVLENDFYQQEQFQALFFEVAGLTLALPLTSLGGIHKLDKIQSIVHKPDWYLGLMPYKKTQLNVVDSASWIMPEKYDDALAQSIEYKYLIMLGDSGWGLTAERLVTTDMISRKNVKWRSKSISRKWLAGMVKEQMCALIDVNELILLLDNGLNNDSTRSKK